MASQLHTRGTVRVLAKLGVLVWLCAAGVAAAQAPKPDPEAERHHRRGLKLLREEPKDFAAAAAEFAAAYAIDPRPRHLFNLALAQRLGGECRKAIDSYRAYLETHPPEIYAKDARTGIERCEQILATAAASTPPAPPVEPQPEAPPSPREPPPPGEPRPSPPAAPQPVAGARGGAALAAPRLPPERGPWYRDRLGTSLVVAGGLFSIAGVACYALARDAAASTFDPGPLDEYEASRARAGSLQLASWITAGAGVALITGGVIRYAMRPAARRVELTLRPSPVGIAMVLGGRF